MEENLRIPKVHLNISCRNLKESNPSSRADSFVEVYQISNSNIQTKLGVTEIVSNNLNPDFMTHFEINYIFSEVQTLRFAVYDSDNGRAIASQNKFIGEVVCTLADIQGSIGQVLKRTITKGNRSNGDIVLRTEQISDNQDRAVFQFQGKNLEDVSGVFQSFKPFFTLNRILEGGISQKVYMSDYIKGKNVIWKNVDIMIVKLCNGDFNTPIRFELSDYHKSGKHELIGSFEFTINTLNQNRQKEFNLINPAKVNKKNYKNSGTIIIQNFQIIKLHPMMDYIKGGCQISLNIAIDFTSSNGHPNDPNSLHFQNPTGRNQYEQALYEVSRILLSYDSDKQVPVYGFGAKIKGSVSHCFNLNLNPDDPHWQPDNPNIEGLDNIMKYYRNIFKYIELAGPTLFSQFLGKVISQIEAQNVNQNNQNYNILLILTDGDIQDMRDTVDLVVKGSHYALSIIIVGIGSYTFERMKELDADEEPLFDSRGTRMERDIVQFVPFRDCNNSPQELTKAVLDEIPREFENYFRVNNIVPNPPIESHEHDQRSHNMASQSPNNPQGRLASQSFNVRINPGHQGRPASGPHSYGQSAYVSHRPVYDSSPDIIFGSAPPNYVHQNSGHRFVSPH